MAVPDGEPDYTELKPNIQGEQMDQSYARLQELAVVAAECRVAIITYQKPSETAPRRRWVEPYAINEEFSDLMVRCYQLGSEPPGAEEGWRTFRLDRLTKVERGERTFTPRRTVRLAEEIAAVKKIEKPKLPPEAELQEKYYAFLRDTINAGHMTDAKAIEAIDKRQGLRIERVRAAHAHVFRAAIDAVMLDGEVSDFEADFLTRVRAFLVVVAWAP